MNTAYKLDTIIKADASLCIGSAPASDKGPGWPEWQVFVGLSTQFK